MSEATNTQIREVTVIEGPSYQYETNPEDCEIGTTWDLLIQAVDTDGNTWTHAKAFDMKHGREDADALAARIDAAGAINTEHWFPGGVWDAYATPQTWDEEKADYYQNEA